MSNTNPFLACITAGAVAGMLSACSLLPTYQDPDRPYQADAQAVVSAVGLHTSMGRACQRIGAIIVESGILLAVASTAGEARHADLVKRLAMADWDSRDCPAAAVPGLSFGTRDMAKQIANRAHKTAGLL